MTGNSLRFRVRETAKRLAYQILLRPLIGPFEPVGGYAWRCRVHHRDGRDASVGETGSSPLQLFENRRHLGPGGAKAGYVESMGRGWYRQNGGFVEFSTSDNSNPNTNGRRYEYSTSTWLFERRSSAPTNFKNQNFTPDAIERDVDYALGAEKYLTVLRDVGILSIAGLELLELGPGMNCGWAVIMACHGAKVTTVDPYPARWQNTYHRRFFERLRSRIADGLVPDVTPVSQLLDGGSFSPKVIRQRDCPVELLDLPARATDLVFSNAVAEHFYDPGVAFRELFRITRPGGYGFHWIDYRDHRDFARPLEYLLLPESDFRIEFGLRRGEMGNRLRGSEMRRAMSDAGFQIVKYEPAIVADESYLADFETRLASCAESPYRSTSREDLQVLSEYICVQRPPELFEEHR